MEHCHTIPKSSFPIFFSAMAKFGQVFAPVKVSEQSFAFKQVTAAEQIAMTALRTILPPKKFFYPQEETLVSYQNQTIKDHIPDSPQRVIFGVHPCDLAGLGVIDTIFTAAPQDNHYLARRKNTVIVGLSCMPDNHCFCKSMGTDTPRSGYDIFLTELADAYFIQVHTPLGGQLLAEFPQELLLSANEEDRLDYKKFWIERDQAFSIGFKGDNLPALMDMEQNNPVWEELGERCLSCGNCTPVCPTCYCFDIIDVAALHSDAGERKRQWDSCQFSGFAKVAGDFNFRPGPVDRLKFWYRHKLHGFEDAFEFPTCVGCGRCTVSCPAGIDDIVGVVLRLQGEKKGEEHGI